MIEMQHMDDRNTHIPDWFVQLYDSGYIWLILAGMFVAVIGLIIVTCRQYFEMKEAERFIREQEELRQERDVRTGF